MRLALPAALLTVIVAAGPAAADDVYLVNGKVFEDVTAEVEGERVAIGLPSGGEIGLPLSHVERIERAERFVDAQPFRGRPVAWLQPFLTRRSMDRHATVTTIDAGTMSRGAAMTTAPDVAAQGDAPTHDAGAHGGSR